MRQLLLWILLAAGPVLAGDKPSFAPQPNWLGSAPDPELIKYYERTIGRDGFSGSGQFYEYTERGPLGIPRVVVKGSADYGRFPDEKGRLKVIPQEAGFATWSCTCLDFVAGQAGGWGPECNITKYLQLPKGKLKKNTGPGTREGDFMYTPNYMPRDSYVTDTARFILENGAGKKVEVVYRILVNRGP